MTQTDVDVSHHIDAYDLSASASAGFRWDHRSDHRSTMVVNVALTLRRFDKMSASNTYARIHTHTIVEMTRVSDASRILREASERTRTGAIR